MAKTIKVKNILTGKSDKIEISPMTHRLDKLHAEALIRIEGVTLKTLDGETRNGDV